MRRYTMLAAAVLITAGLLMAGKVYLGVANAAGAHAKGAGFAKQIYKENRKKAQPKANKATAPRPLGP